MDFHACILCAHSVSSTDNSYNSLRVDVYTCSYVHVKIDIILGRRYETTYVKCGAVGAEARVSLKHAI